MQNSVYGGWSIDQFPDAAAIDELLADHPHEGYTLEYKGKGWGKNPDWKQELCQQVTALANSVGGIIVCGIDENETLPARLDPLSEPVSNQRLTHILSPGVSPPLDYHHLVVKSIEVATGYVSVIFVPESHRPPHMVIARGAFEGRYYKRGLEGTLPMLDGDVRDALGKRQRPDLAMEITKASISERMRRRADIEVSLVLSNHGRAAGRDVAVVFTMPYPLGGLEWSVSPITKMPCSAVRTSRDVWRPEVTVLPGVPLPCKFIFSVNPATDDDAVELVFGTEIFHAEAVDPVRNWFRLHERFASNHAWHRENASIVDQLDPDNSQVTCRTFIR